MRNGRFQVTFSPSTLSRYFVFHDHYRQAFSLKEEKSCCRQKSCFSVLAPACKIVRFCFDIDIEQIYFYIVHKYFKMGLSFSRIWERMFGKKEMRILMVGLDAAGKVSATTFFYVHQFFSSYFILFISII